MNTEIKKAVRANYLKSTRFYRELREELAFELSDYREDFIFNRGGVMSASALPDEVKAMFEPEYVIDHVLPYAYALREVLRSFEVWIVGGYTVPGDHLYEDFTVCVSVSGDTLREIDAATEIDYRGVICDVLPRETGCPYNIELSSRNIERVPHALYIFDEESANGFMIGEGYDD